MYASGPGSPEAPERSSRDLLTLCGGHCAVTLHGQAAGRTRRCHWRTSSGYPPGETQTAESGKAADTVRGARFPKALAAWGLKIPTVVLELVTPPTRAALVY